MLDQAFGQEGISDVNFGRQPLPFTLLQSSQQSTGKFISLMQLGYPLESSAASNAFTFVRQLPTGVRDMSFGQSGTLTLPGMQPVGFALDSNDSIWVMDNAPSALSGAQPHRSFVVAKYTPDGLVDTNFGINGRRVYSISPGAASSTQNGFVSRIMLQTDGRLIVSGAFISVPDVNGSTHSLGKFLARYLVDGQPDSTFGVNGLVTLLTPPLSNDFTSITHITFQPDGKIVVSFGLNFDNTESVIARFLPNGILDITFGIQGILEPCALVGINCTQQSLQFTKLALRPNGAFIAAGETSQFNGHMLIITPVLIYLTADGTLDDSSGPSITAPTLPVGIQEIRVQTLLVRPTGEVVISGAATGQFVNGVEPASVVTMQLSPTRQLDSKFGVGGIVTVTRGGEAIINTRLSPDGSLMHVVSSGYYASSLSRLIRLGAQGQIDAAFNINFTSTTQFTRGTDDQLYWLPLVDAQQRIYISTFRQGQSRLERMNPNGMLDATFVIANPGALLLLNSGKLLSLTDGYLAPNGYNITLRRFLEDGTPDVGFGQVSVQLPITGTLSITAAPILALGNDAALLQLRTCGEGHGNYGSCPKEAVYIARILANGVLDTSFGVDGMVTVPYASYPFALIAPLSTGQFMIGGYAQSGGVSFTRLKTNGAVDTSFAASGVLTVTYVPSQSFAFASIQADDKLIVAQGLSVSRYDKNGVLDTHYGNAGVATLPNPIVTPYVLYLPTYTSLPDGSLVLSAFESPDKVHRVQVDSNGHGRRAWTASLGLSVYAANPYFAGPDGTIVAGSMHGSDSLDVFVAHLITTTFTATQQINLPFLSQGN